MMTKQQWVWLADLYSPLLVGYCLLVLIRTVQIHGRAAGLVALRSVLLALMVVYGVMLIDMIWQIWPAIGLDYSTHTAFALVFVCFLCGVGQWTRWLALASLLLYGYLMVYLDYHTWLDILSTALLVMFLCLGLYSLLIKRKRRQ